MVNKNGSLLYQAVYNVKKKKKSISTLHLLHLFLQCLHFIILLTRCRSMYVLGEGCACACAFGYAYTLSILML